MVIYSSVLPQCSPHHQSPDDPPPLFISSPFQIAINRSLKAQISLRNGQRTHYQLKSSEMIRVGAVSPTLHFQSARWTRTLRLVIGRDGSNEILVSSSTVSNRHPTESQPRFRHVFRGVSVFCIGCGHNFYRDPPATVASSTGRVRRVHFRGFSMVRLVGRFTSTWL